VPGFRHKRSGYALTNFIADVAWRCGLTEALGAKENKVRVKTLVSLLFLCQFAFAGENADPVERFVSAFNQHDVNGMIELTTPDVRWMSVSGKQISIEASTHAELSAAMTGYFESTPGARAEIGSISESGQFVHTLERAFWLADGAERSQCSMAVYELLDGKIQNVWYFPTHQCP
jgi:hypothetical protein